MSTAVAVAGKLKEMEFGLYTQPDEFEEEDPEKGGEQDQEAEELQVYVGSFVDDVRTLARDYVERFFADKRMACGGRIPKYLLHNERRISMVMNYTISIGVDQAYKALEPLLSEAEQEEARRTGEATSDIKLVNETLNLLARSGIPQQFAGGMLLLYLEFVEGVHVGT